MEIEYRDGGVLYRWSDTVDLAHLSETIAVSAQDQVHASNYDPTRIDHAPLAVTKTQEVAAGILADRLFRRSCRQGDRLRWLVPDLLEEHGLAGRLRIELAARLDDAAVGCLLGLPFELLDENVDRVHRYSNGTSVGPKPQRSLKVLVLIGSRGGDDDASQIPVLPGPSGDGPHLRGLRWECPATPESVLELIEEQPWDVVILVGHADSAPDELVVSPGDSGESAVTGGDLTRAVRRSGASLVILLACTAAGPSSLLGLGDLEKPSLAQTVLDSGVPEVIAPSVQIAFGDAARSLEAVIEGLRHPPHGGLSPASLGRLVVDAFAPAGEADRRWHLRSLRRDPPRPLSEPSRTIRHPWAAFSPFGRYPYGAKDVWVPLLLDIGATAELASYRSDVAPWVRDLEFELEQVLGGLVEEKLRGRRVPVVRPTRWSTDVPGVEFAQAMAMARLLSEVAGVPLPDDIGRRVAEVLGLDGPWWFHGTIEPWWGIRSPLGFGTCAPPSVPRDVRFVVWPAHWRPAVVPSVPTWEDLVCGWDLPDLCPPVDPHHRDPWSQVGTDEMVTVTPVPLDNRGDTIATLPPPMAPVPLWRPFPARSQGLPDDRGAGSVLS